MGKWIIPALIAIVYFLSSRKSSAAELPPVEPEREPATPPSGGSSGSHGMTYTGPIPGYGRVNPMNRDDVLAGWDDALRDMERDWPAGRDLYIGRHRADFDAHPIPVPPPMVAVVMYRESGGVDQPPGEPLATGDREEGYMQLTPAEVDAAGGGNPHNFRDSIRMAQRLYQQAINRYPSILTNGRDELFAALVSRSIGQGAFRWLLSRIPLNPEFPYLVDRVELWLQETPERPVGIRQSDRNFTRRIVRAMLRADRAVDEGWVSISDELPRLF